MWPFKKDIKREWDFEGRCTKCHKYLPLILEVISKHEIRLTITPCIEHPEDSLILWPQRDDVIRM